MSATLDEIRVPLPGQRFNAANVIRAAIGNLYCDPAELAAVFGVSIRTIHAWSRNQALPPLAPIGRKLMFYRSDIVSYAEGWLGLSPMEDTAYGEDSGKTQDDVPAWKQLTRAERAEYLAAAPMTAPAK